MSPIDAFNVSITTCLQHAVVRPGDIVEGHAVVTVTKPIHMVAICVEVTGEESLGIIYKQLITLAGHTKSSGCRDAMELPAGRYTYPFSFRLPPCLPPSFDATVFDRSLWIRYLVRSYVAIPHAHEVSQTAPLQVESPMPQIQWDRLAPAVAVRTYTVKWLSLFNKGTVSAEFSMDRTLIAVDRDRLTVRAKIDNTLGSATVTMSLSLMRNITLYESKTHLHIATYAPRAIARTEVPDAVVAGERRELVGTIPFPETMPLSLRGFRIRCSYDVRIELRVPFASKMTHTVPVLIAPSVDVTNTSPRVQLLGCLYTLRTNEPEQHGQTVAATCDDQPVTGWALGHDGSSDPKCS